MKLYHLIVLLTIFLVLTSCSKSETPTPKPDAEEQPDAEEPKEPLEPKIVSYLKFKTNPYQNTDLTDDYVVVHDQNGRFLGYQSFEKGDELVFQTMNTSLVETTTLTMTVIQILNYQNITSHEVQSYTEIEIGSELFPATPDLSVGKAPNNTLYPFKNTNLKTKSTIAQNQGIFDLTIANTNGVARYAISNEIHGPAKIDYMPQEINSLVLNDLQLQLNKRYLISLEDLEGNFRYLFFEVPEINGKIDLDFNNFLEFDDILEVSLPEHRGSSGSAIGYSSSEATNVAGFHLGFHSVGSEMRKIRFGYIDSLEYYSTHLFVSVNLKFDFFHTEKGLEIPKNIAVLAQPSFTIKNNSLQTFQFETDASYLQSEVVWHYWNQNANDLSISTSWRVYSSPGKHPVIGELPHEIVENHPEFNLEKLTYNRTELITQGSTYEDYLKTSFGLEPAPNEWVIEKIRLLH